VIQRKILAAPEIFIISAEMVVFPLRFVYWLVCLSAWSREILLMNFMIFWKR